VGVSHLIHLDKHWAVGCKLEHPNGTTHVPGVLRVRDPPYAVTRDVHNTKFVVRSKGLNCEVFNILFDTGIRRLHEYHRVFRKTGDLDCLGVVGCRDVAHGVLVFRVHTACIERL
jgi:hypothetical protein